MATDRSHAVTVGSFTFAVRDGELHVSGKGAEASADVPQAWLVKVDQPGSSAQRTEKVRNREYVAWAYESALKSSVVINDMTGAHTIERAAPEVESLTAQLNQAARVWPGWAVPAVLALVAGLVLYGISVWLLVLVWIVGAVVALIRWRRVEPKRRVVVLFDMSLEAAVWYEQVLRAWRGICDSEHVWRTVRSGEVQTRYQYKVHSGSGVVREREPAAAALSGAKHLLTNIDIPTLSTESASVHFLPDRVIMREGRKYQEMSYRDLGVHVGTIRQVETGGVSPRDAYLEELTWLRVNLAGGPDRRFSVNPQVPAFRYGQLDLVSPTGLQWQIVTSRAGAVDPVARVIGGASATGR